MTSAERAGSIAVVIGFALTTIASAAPVPGGAFPSFVVNDLAGTAHTQRDLTGRWTIVLAMTDKDAGPAVSAWYSRLEPSIPPGGRILTFAALDLFPMIPTATIVSEARSATPRNRWGEVWLSRDGSLARSVGLSDSETPWVFVVDPSGRVVVSVHNAVSEAGVAWVAGALRRARANTPR